MATAKEIQETVERANAVVARWRSMDEPRVPFQGKSCKAVSDPVVEAINEVAQIAGTPNSNVEDSARRVVLAIDEFADHLNQWYTDLSFGPDHAPPDGSSLMWQAWDAVVAACVPRRSRPPESMDDLTRSNTSLAQIAKIYGWKNEDGSPDIQKVVEEQNKPGTHYDPETWVHPADRNLQASADEQWKRRQPREHLGQPVASRTGHVAPEPLDELIQTVDNAKQIARMKGITVEEVEARAAELGVAIDGKFRKPSNPEDQAKAKEAATQRQQEAYAKSYPEITDMEERVVMLHLDGWKPAKIAETLNVDYPTLNFQKVGKIVAAAEKEDAAKVNA